MSLIYWIHKKDNEDYLTEGYIGKTDRSLEERIYEHKKSSPNKKFKNFINKYGWDNVIIEVIFEGTKEECIGFENYLRNDFNIGLNHKPGGSGGNSVIWTEEKRIEHGKKYAGEKNPMYGKPRPEEIKVIISEKLKGRYKGTDSPHYGVKKSKEQIEKRRVSLGEKFAGANNPNAKIDKDGIAFIINSGLKTKDLSEILKLSVSQVNRIKKRYLIKGY